MTRRTLMRIALAALFSRDAPHRHGTSPHRDSVAFQCPAHLDSLYALSEVREKVTVSTETDICEPLRQSTDSRADRSLPASRSPKGSLPRRSQFCELVLLDCDRTLIL